jgi:CBS domain-containing protein
MYEFLAYRVRHAMTSEPVTIEPRATLAEAQRLFEKHDFNALPVVDAETRLVGILTKLDVLRSFAFTPESVIPRYEDVMRQTVESQMSSTPVSVDPELPLTRVLQTMIQTRNKSLPVVADGRLVGMIAREDILVALRRAVAGEPP